MNVPMVRPTTTQTRQLRALEMGTLQYVIKCVMLELYSLGDHVRALCGNRPPLSMGVGVVERGRG
jgi:hypothetical protein